MNGFDLFEAAALISDLKRNLRSPALLGALCLILMASFAQALAWETTSMGTGSNSPSQQPTTQFPIQIELLPGKLKVRVWLHEIDSRKGPVSCWSYITEGLQALGHEELIFTLNHNSAEKPGEYPRDPLAFFKAIYQSAAEGRMVNVGALTELGEDGFLGRRDFRAITYIRPESLKGVEMKAPLLAAIALTGDELDVAKTFGMTRVLGLLGQAYRHYPCPPWVDRARNSLVSMKEMKEQSILAKALRSTARGVSVIQESDARGSRVIQEKNRITLRALTGARPQLQALLARIPPSEALALLTEPDTKASACLVWQAGQSKPTAIGLDGSDLSRLTGNFILFLPSGAENGNRMFEDGFSVFLTDDAWQAVRQALESGKPISIKAANGEVVFALEWIEQSYVNPIDGRRYEAKSGWETYEPQPPAPQSPAPRKKDDVTNVEKYVLLTSQEEMAKRISVDALVDFLKQVAQVVETHFKSLPRQAGQELYVQYDLQPGRKAEYQMASRPGIDDKIMQQLWEKLSALNAPGVKGQVSFQIIYTIWGGPGAAAKPTK